MRHRPDGEPSAASAAVVRFVAEELRRCAGAIADDWIEALKGRLRLPPARFLPTDYVRDHVPELVVEVSDQLLEPDGELSDGAVDSLRTFAELRREQGYHESEVLAELGALHLAIFSGLGDALRRYPDAADHLAVAEVSRRMQEILDRLSATLVGILRERERQESKELSRRLSEFTGTILHELKDPLNAASQGARLLAAERLSSREREDLHELVTRNLRKIEDFLSDLTMVEDVEATRAEGRWVRLPDAVDDVLDQCSEEADRRNVRVEVGSVPDVTVDAGAVEIPLRNLVWNAVKYSDPEEDDLWVRISFSPAEEGSVGVERWRITVADNGIGIPADVRDRVFERGFRASPEGVSGSGLGLSIARQMARQRGGDISFESHAGAGSVFHLDVREQRVEPDGEA